MYDDVLYDIVVDVYTHSTNIYTYIHNIKLHNIKLHNIKLHYTIHNITLHYITLHYIHIDI